MYIMCLSKGLDAVLEWKKEFKPTRPIGFIPNAGDTYKDPYFVRDSWKRLELLQLSLIEIDLRKISSSVEFENIASKCDGVFVAGGNSFNLLKELRHSNAFEPLKKLILHGFPYFGESAGAVVLYKTLKPVEMIDSPQDVAGLTSTDGLDVVDFLTLPHIDREKYADLFNTFYTTYKDEHKILKIRDDQALLTRDGSTAVLLESAVRDVG
jgi:dipeptidase E